MVLDAGSRRLVDGVVQEDDILKENVTSKSWKGGETRNMLINPDVEQIEEKRPMNKGMDAIYLLSPLPHIVDCLMADLERRRYRRYFVIWTSCETALRSR